MNKIIDFKCNYENSVGISKEVTEKTRLKFPEAYKYWDSMAKLALELKKHDNSNFCELPFCHTIEGEALGGIINYGDENIGPRGKEYICTTAEDLLNLPKIDYSKGRIAEVLKACSYLREQGENVVLYISGPFTILNILIDPRHIFKIFRKNNEAMKKILNMLKEEILCFVKEAQKARVNMISYADSTGGVNILGPKLAEEIAETFTYPLLKEVEKILDDKTIMLLCPKTSFAMLGIGKAQWQDIDLGSTMKYSEGCEKVIGQAKFVGQMCVKNREFELTNGIIKILELR